MTAHCFHAVRFCTIPCPPTRVYMTCYFLFRRYITESRFQIFSIYIRAFYNIFRPAIRHSLAGLYMHRLLHWLVLSPYYTFKLLILSIYSRSITSRALFVIHYLFYIYYISYLFPSSNYSFEMPSRASRFVQRFTRSVHRCVRRVIRRRSRRNSTIVIPAVNESRSSAGRDSSEVVYVGTESTSTDDVNEASAADTLVGSRTSISEPRASSSTTGATLGLSDATTLQGSIFSQAEVEVFGPPVNILEGIENEWFYNMGKRSYISAN